MPCLNPMDAFFGPGKSVNGKRVIVFKRELAAKDSERFFLPCGQCQGCRLARSGDWAVRLMHEAQMHAESCWFTLTYAPEHFPSDGSLNKRDYQVFIKSLRDELKPLRIRFFLSGEYGESRDRLHWHVIIFGWKPDDLVLCRREGSFDYYRSDFLASVWGKGFVEVSDLSLASAQYVAKYCMKKVNGPLAERLDPVTGLRHYESIDSVTGDVVERLPEFGAMSTHPGIGKGWLLQYWSDVFPHDTVVVNTGSKYVERGAPKYYRRVLEQVNGLESERLGALRAAKAAASPDNTRPRLAVRKKCLEARTKRLRKGALRG